MAQKHTPLPYEAREKRQLLELNCKLRAAWSGTPEDHEVSQALRCYLETMTLIGRRFRMFEIANHRFFKAGDTLVIPYNAHGRLDIHVLAANGTSHVIQRVLRHGEIITDELVLQIAGLPGVAIDLEHEIYHLQLEDMPAIRIARLRDLADILERLNRCGSRHEAVYLLRFVVASLCSRRGQSMPGAKNLQVEVARVRRALAELLNGPFAGRLRLPMRTLVRSVSDLVSRPKLIDEVWQDTIDLSEIHVRGSTIANEIRRSTHHALGMRTLALARSYLHWLETGQAEFPDPGREIPGPQDAAARLDPGIIQLTRRIVHNLQNLMGSSQIVERVSEWRDDYSSELMRCESGSLLTDELESLVNDGIRVRNRWIYQLRIRTIAGKARNGCWPENAGDALLGALDELQQCLPDADDFDAQAAESMARESVGQFAETLQRNCRQPLFAALDNVLGLYEQEHHANAFETGSKLRHSLDSIAGDGVFTSQKFLLHQLDCLLEEMGYLALRHVASAYESEGVDIEECLHIVHTCAGNLVLSGLFSREIWDLTAMLVDAWRTPAQMVEVLECIQRHYHRLVHRVSIAYEVMSGELGYSENEIRAVLGNYQRTMHDLNSLVHFADLARCSLMEDQREIRWSTPSRMAEDPWDFIHLSHGEDITQRVNDWQTRSLQDRYGGKGSGLIYIAYLGIPTRDGFIIPTTLPRLGLHRTERTRLAHEVLRHVTLLEADIESNEATPVRLGDPEAPLLLAVRGGSLFSMPGILETVVFVGMTDAVAEALAKEDEWYAWDAYRRFLASYADAAWGLNLEDFDLVEKAKRRYGVSLKTELPGPAMREVVESSKAVIRSAGHGEALARLTCDAEFQLHTSIEAVHASWDAERAVRYRAIKHISSGWQTAVIVQQMASGNRSNPELHPGMDERAISLTGVIPSTLMQATGFRTFTGDIKFSACGDDLVGGLTTPLSFQSVQQLHSLAPMLERRLNHIGARLRRFRGTDAEIEFTVDCGVLSVLQARSAQPEEYGSPRTFDRAGTADCRGIGISGGAFRGLVAFDEADLISLRKQLETAETDEIDGVLLVLENPIPDQIPLILSADALLTSRGGSTSHAAVAVHGIENKPYSAVLGVGNLRVDRGVCVLEDEHGTPVWEVRRGEVLSIHGRTGEVFLGSKPVLDLDPGTHSTETT